MYAQGHFSAGYQSFPLVGNLSLKKDAGQAGMTRMQPMPAWFK
jgi:hypothetical protein